MKSQSKLPQNFEISSFYLFILFINYLTYVCSRAGSTLEQVQQPLQDPRLYGAPQYLRSEKCQDSGGLVSKVSFFLIINIKLNLNGTGQRPLAILSIIRLLMFKKFEIGISWMAHSFNFISIRCNFEHAIEFLVLSSVLISICPLLVIFHSIANESKCKIFGITKLGPKKYR